MQIKTTTNWVFEHPLTVVPIEVSPANVVPKNHQKWWEWRFCAVDTGYTQQHHRKHVLDRHFWTRQTLVSWAMLSSIVIEGAPMVVKNITQEWQGQQTWNLIVRSLPSTTRAIFGSPLIQRYPTRIPIATNFSSARSLKFLKFSWRLYKWRAQRKCQLVKMSGNE